MAETSGSVDDKEKLVAGRDCRKSYESTADASDHCHDESDAGTQVDKTAQRKLVIASFLCLIFMIGEIVGGALANSLAIMTDAAHLLADFASFLISLLAMHLASLPATKELSFGWHRAEVMGALTSVLMIWVVTGVLVYMAVQRVVSRDFEVHGRIMVITASVGVAINMAMACVLHQHGHSHWHSQLHWHSHSHSHGSGNMNVRAAYLHAVGDIMQSVGVLVAAVIISIEPRYKLADPICTFVFSLLVLCTTLAVLRDAMSVLMEGAPKGVDYNAVDSGLRSLDGVKGVHDLRVWSLATHRSALSVHLVVDEGSEQTQEILKAARKLVKREFKIDEITIQLETYDKEMAQCRLCQQPKE